MFMTLNRPRCIFQLDGVDGGVLSVAERPLEEGRVLLVINHNGQEAQLSLDEDAFMQLVELRYHLRFKPEEATQSPALRVVA